MGGSRLHRAGPAPRGIVTRLNCRWRRKRSHISCKQCFIIHLHVWQRVFLCMSSSLVIILVARSPAVLVKHGKGGMSFYAPQKDLSSMIEMNVCILNMLFESVKDYTVLLWCLSWRYRGSIEFPCCSTTVRKLFANSWVYCPKRVSVKISLSKRSDILSSYILRVKFCRDLEVVLFSSYWTWISNLLISLLRLFRNDHASSNDVFML